MRVATGFRARERVVVHVDSSAARWISALAVLSLSGWLFLLHKDFAWSMTILAAVAVIARGVFLGRPVTAWHATAAMLMCVVGLGRRFPGLRFARQPGAGRLSGDADVADVGAPESRGPAADIRVGERDEG